MQINGMRLMYNLCYRCEGAQAVILSRRPKRLLHDIKTNFAGDPDVKKHLHRVELALKHNGWRGNVEDIIEIEMRGESVASAMMRSVKLMTDQEFENMFADGSVAVNTLPELPQAEGKERESIAWEEKPGGRLDNGEPSMFEDDDALGSHAGDLAMPRSYMDVQSTTAASEITGTYEG